MTSEEREERLAFRIRESLQGGALSTPEARREVMNAVRAAATEAPNAGIRRAGWRSPAIGLLAAASIAGIIAVVHARGIAYVPAPVPGIVAPANGAAAATPAVARAVDEGSGTVRVQFVLVAPTAKQVSVVGDFNDWNPSATQLVSVSGVWSSETVVTAGRHDYAFVIDGNRWIADPTAPRAPADELGGGYSVLLAGVQQ